MRTLGKPLAKIQTWLISSVTYEGVDLKSGSAIILEFRLLWKPWLKDHLKVTYKSGPKSDRLKVSKSSQETATGECCQITQIDRNCHSRKAWLWRIFLRNWHQTLAALPSTGLHAFTLVCRWKEMHGLGSIALCTLPLSLQCCPEQGSLIFTSFMEESVWLLSMKHTACQVGVGLNRWKCSVVCHQSTHESSAALQYKACCWTLDLCWLVCVS